MLDFVTVGFPGHRGHDSSKAEEVAPLRRRPTEQEKLLAEIRDLLKQR
jgi:large-conductance mechanosensitive channel